MEERHRSHRPRLDRTQPGDGHGSGVHRAPGDGAGPSHCGGHHDWNLRGWSQEGRGAHAAPRLAAGSRRDLRLAPPRQHPDPAALHRPQQRSRRLQPRHPTGAQHCQPGRNGARAHRCAARPDAGSTAERRGTAARGALSVAMRRVLTRATLALATLVVASPLAAQREPYRNRSLPTDQRVADLLDRMTLREKFWQLYMSPGSLDDPSHDYSNGAFGLQIVTTDSSGDPAHIARVHAERINTIQRYFVEQTRLGIPIIPFDEVLHGLMRHGATIFPQAIGMAATWDSSLVARVAGAIALEARHRGVRQGLSPVVNLASDVRWGRTEETWGEDPFLTSRLGVAFTAPFEWLGVITTPKHFVANVGDGGRD